MTTILPGTGRPLLAAWLRAGMRVGLFFLAALLFALTTRVAEPVAASPEMFHEGEYVGSLWHMKAWSNNKAPFPLLIHGAMDYVPSQIAQAIYGSSRIIGGTRIVNTVVVVTVWVLFMELVYQMSASATRARWRHGLALGLFALMAPPWFSLPVQVTEAFTGVRDLFLLLILLTFLHYWKKTGRSAMLLASAGTALLPLAISWSYDRGIMAMGFTGLMFGAMALQRRWQDLILSAGSLLAAWIVLERSRFFGSFPENAGNILYWIRQSGTVWGLPFQLPELNSVLGVLLIALCLAVAAMAVRDFRLNRSPDSFWILAGLLLVQLLLAKSSLNRPAGNRVLMALFPSILVMVHYGTRLMLSPSPGSESRSDSPPVRSRLIPKALFAGSATLFAVILGLILLPVESLTMSGRTFFRTMAQPRPDLKMVPPEVAELGLALRKSPSPALFGWCNEGILNLIARKPWATRFPYAVYTSPSHEQEILAGLQAVDLQEMVTHPGAWSMGIDGRAMTDRLPAVDQYIKSRFTAQEAYGDYLLLRQPGPP